MTLVMVLLTIAVVAVVAAVATGLISGGMPEPATSIPQRALPDRPLTGQDVNDLRFVQGLRGYRMDQVDAAMDALAAELDRLRAELQNAEHRQPAGTGLNGAAQPGGSDAPSGPAQPPQPSYGHFGAEPPSWPSQPWPSPTSPTSSTSSPAAPSWQSERDE